MNNEIKNKIIELYLQGDLSQRKIANQAGVAQSSVSNTIKAYKNGTFIYRISSGEKHSIKDKIPEIHSQVETTSIPINEHEHQPDLLFTPDIYSSHQKNKYEYEQTKPSSLVNKSKIIFTNHGLWLNKFALQLLDNPTYLSYSFDAKNSNLYIASYDKENLSQFYICSAKCSKNYTKTTNRPLITEIQKTLETEFKDIINLNDTFKIHFNFTFENGQFTIHTPSIIL